MKSLKYACLSVALLTLAACGQGTPPQIADVEEPSLKALDVLNVDILNTTTTTVNLGSIEPGKSASHTANLYVQCDKQKHAVTGSMGFTITGGTAEVLTEASLSIPNTWPADNKNCASPAQVANGSLKISVNVPTGATLGSRSVKLTVTSNDSDLNGSASRVEVTVTYEVKAAAPTDSTDPTVNVTLPSPGTSGWFITSPVIGSVSANDLSNVADITCSGATVSDKTGLGTTSASAKLTVSAEGVNNITCTAKDGANNTGAAAGSANTGTVKIDTDAPTVDLASVNNTDWRNTSLSQAFTALDSVSGLADAGDESFTLTAFAESTKDSDGNIVPTVASKTVLDRAGNATTRSVSAQIDTTKPTITASAKTADGQAYTSGTWTNQNVTVSFTCSDALSGIVQDTCPAPVTVSSDTAASGQTIFDHVSDRASNMETSNAVVVKVDKTAPTITYDGRTPSTNDYGWNNSDVTVNWSCSDTLSGAVAATASQTVSAEGNNQSTTGSCTDNAGNRVQNIQSGINIDKTAPDVSVTNVSNITYTLGSVPTAGCSTSDTLSGVKNFASPSTNGGTVGSVTVTCSGAEDKAGNTNSASVSYNVIYNFTGFFSPVDMNGVFNVAKAGSAIPVKFKLGGNQGLNIFASGYPKAVTVNCSTSASSDLVEEFATATTSGLKYDATADQYNYTWKTSSRAGTCVRLEVKLVDGKTYTALFSFK